MDSLDATRDTYERIAGEYTRRHADRSVIAHLREPFLDRLRRDATVLDVGCGPGWEAAAFREAGCAVLAIDLAAAFCGQAAGRVPGRVVRGDMRRLPVAAHSVDGLWACASLLHLPRSELVPTLEEFHRVLRDRGVCCVSVKAGSGTMAGGAYDGDRRRFTLFRRDEFGDALETSGFAIDRSTVEDGWLHVFANKRV